MTRETHFSLNIAFIEISRKHIFQCIVRCLMASFLRKEIVDIWFRAKTWQFQVTGLSGEDQSSERALVQLSGTTELDNSFRSIITNGNSHHCSKLITTLLVLFLLQYGQLLEVGL